MQGMQMEGRKWKESKQRRKHRFEHAHLARNANGRRASSGERTDASKHISCMLASKARINFATMNETRKHESEI